MQTGGKVGYDWWRDIIRLAQGHRAADESVHLWEELSSKATFQWQGVCPVVPWRMDPVPPNVRVSVLGQPWKSDYQLLSYLPSTSHELRPQQCISPWRSVWLANARSLPNSLKELGPPRRPPPPPTNPLVKGRDLLVWVRLLACGRPLPHFEGESDTDGEVPPPLIAWASGWEMVLWKRQGQSGFRGL